MKELYSEICKTLMKEIKNTNKGNIFHIHELEELIVLKCQYYQKACLVLMWSLLRFQWQFLHKWKKNTPKIYMYSQKTPHWHTTDQNSVSSNPLFSLLQFCAFYPSFFEPIICALPFIVRMTVRAIHRILWTWRRRARDSGHILDQPDIC